MGFLGSTNQFRGRVEAGGVRVGADLIPCSTVHLNGTKDVIAFTRPHETDIIPNQDVTYGIAAKVDRILNLGPIARVELTALALKDEHGAPQRLDAELTQRELSGLRLDAGQHVRLVSRNLRVFPDASVPPEIIKTSQAIPVNGTP